MNNIISVVGKVLTTPKFDHYSRTFGNIFSFALEVPRPSGIMDENIIKIPECLLPNLSIGDLVDVVGTIQTRNIYNRLLIFIWVEEIHSLSDIPYLSNQNVNHVLQGFICKNQLPRETPFGRKITDFMIAINYNYYHSAYIPCIAWENTCDEISSLKLGTEIKVRGRLQSRKYNKRISGYPDIFEEKTAYEFSVSRLLPIKK